MDNYSEPALGGNVPQQSTPDTPPVMNWQVKQKPKKKARGFAKGFISGMISMLLIFTLISGALLGWGRGAITPHSISKLAALERVISQYYYEDIDTGDLETGMYKGIMESMGDPYTAYYTKKEFSDLMAGMTGSYAGIGATLSKKADTGECVIVSVYDGTPAKEAGLGAGDIIRTADGHKSENYELDDFVQFIRGKEGTTVKLGIVHADGTKEQVDVTRRQITIPTVTHQMATDKIGYIRIDQFADGTCQDYMDAMEDLKGQGMQAVIFDLRYNPGGMVDSVTDILGQILPEGISVYMLDKNGKRTEYKSDGRNELDMPIVVLTSGNTASAAEIFSGAIRDYHKGTLIGQKTFGKGIVQQTMQLADGSAVKITIARYYTPSGECIHKKGITPDIEMEYQYTGSTTDTSYDILKDNEVMKGIEVLNSEL